MGTSTTLPILYVEGTDDISVISALLYRHKIDTKRGAEFLNIKNMTNDDKVLGAMPEAIKTSTSQPVGFVIDIDVDVTHRWAAVCGRLREAGIIPPRECPHGGYFGRLPSYPHQFGIWLMPDCKTDGCKLEHLIQSLMPAGNPLWPHAQLSTANAASLIDNANMSIAPSEKQWKRFGEVDRIKAEVRSWLAWQSNPGVQLGAALNDGILDHDSPEALAFLLWLKNLYGFSQLAV